MTQEIRPLEHNNTRNLIPPPTELHIVRCKWMLKIKRHANGSIKRYNALFVAKGYHQEGVDYFETFTSIVRPTTIRVVLTLALSNGWHTRQLDIHNAFLHDNLNEKICVQQSRVSLQ
jgi:Reverse transcriptase (RNA-dependent DNA polymerase)